MTQLRSHAHIELMLNGHRFVGWAEDDPPYEFEYEDASELKRGQDGGMYGLSMPSFGGILTIKLQPASPTAQWCIQQEQIRKNLQKSKAQSRIYRGTLSDPAVGITAELAGGSSFNFPHGRLLTRPTRAGLSLRRSLLRLTVEPSILHS